jgi:hypothetical protein
VVRWASEVGTSVWLLPIVGIWQSYSIRSYIYIRMYNVYIYIHSIIIITIIIIIQYSIYTWFILPITGIYQSYPVFRIICPLPSYAKLCSVATTLQQSFSFRIRFGRCHTHPGVPLAAWKRGDLPKGKPAQMWPLMQKLPIKIVVFNIYVVSMSSMSSMFVYPRVPYGIYDH